MSKPGMESTGASAERGLTSHRQDAAGDDFAAAAVTAAVAAVAAATVTAAVAAAAVAAAIAASVSAASVLCICEKKICLLKMHKKS